MHRDGGLLHDTAHGGVALVVLASGDVPGSRAETLLDVMASIERYTLRRAWTDLTDDELHWEALPGSWGVHPVGDVRTPTPFVSGDWAADFDTDVAMASMAGPTEPLTTIGWLYWHVGSCPGRLVELDFFGGPHPTESGWLSPYIATHPVFPTADDAVTTMREGWRALGSALRAATDSQLETPIRFWGYGGPGPEGTGAHVVAHTLNEVSHHATQICVTRDLYRLTR